MKIAALLILSLLPLLSFGQRKGEFKMTQNIGPKTDEPTYVIVIDSSQIIVQYNTLEKVKKKWIKEIKILKDSESQEIYGHQNGVILIFLKTRYQNRMLRLIKTQK